MKYRWLAPEIMQVSQMDCGPSSLKSILDGFGIPINFSRLRELCQTDVDGTSVDTLEELALTLGLEAEQVLVPLNQLELPEARVAPCILITRLPNGLTHFIVVWRSLGKWVQIMDPSSGRQWVTWEALKARTYRHRMALDKSIWEAWANSEDFRLATLHRLRKLGATAAEAERLTQGLFVLEMSESDEPEASAETHEGKNENKNGAKHEGQNEVKNEEPTAEKNSAINSVAGPGNWLAIASFDAALSWAEALLACGALKSGNECLGFLRSRFESACATPQPWDEAIPRQYWWTLADPKDAGQVRVEACVLVRICGVKEPEAVEEANNPAMDNLIQQPEPSPWQVLYDLLLPAQRKWFGWLGGAVGLAALGFTLQALIFQGLISMNQLLGQQQFSWFIPLVFAFVALSAVLELPIAQLTLSLGRQLEAQFRIALFEKLPKIHDPYFRTRLLTDMARRSHKLYQLRNLPAFAVALLQQGALVLFTLAGLLWLDVAVGLMACLLVAAILLLSSFWQKLLQDSVSRAHNQTGLINMFYFDSLKGLRAIRSHAAEQTFANEQEIQLNYWGYSQYDYQRKQTLVLLVIDVLALMCLLGFMLGKVAEPGGAVPNLLWFYWLLRLPFMARHLAELILQIPNYRLVLALFSELLQATEVEAVEIDAAAMEQSPQDVQASANSSVAEKIKDAASVGSHTAEEKVAGVAITMKDVSLVVAGHPVLNGINVAIQPGEQLAVVGESGAGKSSLCELLLGWKTPSDGQLLVDGVPLAGQALLDLRKSTAWVDANVQLWNKSLLDNINYDHGQGRVADAGLGSLLAHLDQGLQTPLGEDGKRLSGGEGQRVRIGRALGVDQPRLVILDEPCRGLDRPAREQLLEKIRTTHAGATLICITHDISEALKFPRVLVIANGQLLEDSAPQILLRQPQSALNYLRECEERVLNNLLQDQQWHSLKIAQGGLKFELANQHQHPHQQNAAAQSAEVAE
jgi:ABC-type bacteriocin/lantibiotic exporter with double-glycine peptidase domain